MNNEAIYSALEAMKEQDALSGNEQQRSNSKIIMSIETYEQMQRDPEIAKNIYDRINNTNRDTLYDTIEDLKKW